MEVGPIFLFNLARGKNLFGTTRDHRDIAGSRCLDVSYDGRKIARSASTKKVVETAGAPPFYFASGDVDTDCLYRANPTSVCEWKGLAVSVDLMLVRKGVGLGFHRHLSRVHGNGGFYAFYPGKLDCRIDGENGFAPRRWVLRRMDHVRPGWPV
ncbi:MAG: hypothetical protein CM1200mP9_01670 [Gammaproteobacteria bacterium]|nr:MAG: hypothetical protein CM1200mP9_01670 [Gammaproteobacteria bacterium]